MIGTGLACILTLFLLFQNVTLSNTAYMKKELEANSTLSTMTRVVAMMEQQEEYIFGETPVAFIGTGEAYDTIPGFERASKITGLDGNNSIPMDGSYYYYNAYKAYFEYVLNYPIHLCEDSLHAELKQSDAVQALPAFPSSDCMTVIDGVLVIKMGG